MGFRLEFLGAEVGSNRKLLEENKVVEVGFSFYRLLKRGLPKDSSDLIHDRMGDMTVHLYPGLPEKWDGDLDEFAAQYEKFVIDNEWRLTSVQEIDRGTPAWIRQQRASFYDHLDEATFRPVWHKAHGNIELQRLAERYEAVAVPDETINVDTTLAARIITLKRQHQATFHAIGCARPDNLRQIPFDSASTLAWLTPQMRGETVVWDGNRIIRYPKSQKDQARLRHRSTWVKAGFTPELIETDDYGEVIAATIWAYKQLEASVDKRRGDRPFTVIEGGEEATPVSEISDNSGNTDIEVFADADQDDVGNKGVEVRHEVTPRDPSEIRHLPVLNIRTEQITEQTPHGQVLREIGVVESSQGTLRQCDTCYVASNCPAMKPGSACTFNLPVEVKTKEQLKALLTAMLEMQTQRVAFARFSEELGGGYPDPNVSQEMDRLFKLVKQMKELDESKEFIKITAERHAAGGVLSAIFGEKPKGETPLNGGGFDADQTNRIISGTIE